MMLQKSKVKALINEAGCRLNPDAIDGINRAVEGLIMKVVAKAKEDGMKTVMPQHTSIEQSSARKGRACQRCCMVKDTYLRWGKEVQAFCHEQATILSREV